MRRLRLIASAGVLAVLVSCPDPEGDPDDTVIVVGIAPERTFVERLLEGSGRRVRIDVLLPAGSNPHTYEPEPARMRALSRARLLFHGHLALETAWRERFQAVAPEVRFVDLTAGLADLEEHGHPNPHVWLSPVAVASEVRRMHEELRGLFPEESAILEQNLRSLLAQIEALDRELRADAAGLQGHSFLVFHPAWAYFARDYGLTMLSIEEFGMEPGPRGLGELIQEARRRKIDTIFVQPEYDTRPAEMVARELNARVVPISVLDEDWFAMLRSASREIFAAARRSEAVL